MYSQCRDALHRHNGYTDLHKDSIQFAISKQSMLHFPCTELCTSIPAGQAALRLHTTPVWLSCIPQVAQHIAETQAACNPLPRVPRAVKSFSGEKLKRPPWAFVNGRLPSKAEARDRPEDVSHFVLLSIGKMKSVEPVCSFWPFWT